MHYSATRAIIRTVSLTPKKMSNRRRDSRSTPSAGASQQGNKSKLGVVPKGAKRDLKGATTGDGEVLYEKYIVRDGQERGG